MPDWGEEVAVELEALRATYEDDLALDELAGMVSMLLQPSEPQEHAYVQCLLQVTVPRGYPEAAAPGIALQEAKGLGSSRLKALQGLLQREADGMLGEMMLGQLFECGRDWLNDNNWPEGPCIFCLEELRPSGSSSSSSSGAYMRLPCFHAFHQSCFADWWCWQQQALREQQQQLEQRTGATAAAALAQERLPAKEGGHFLLTCPSCRAGFSLEQDLQHMVQHLTTQQQQHARCSSSAAGASRGTGSSPDGKLTTAELAPFKDIQLRHAVLFAEQRKRQGIIVDASYSITDVPNPGAAAAAAAADSGNTRSSRSENSRGCCSSRNSSRGVSSSRGDASTGSAVQGTAGAGRPMSISSSSRGRPSSRGRGGVGSRNAYDAGRGSRRSGRGDQSAGRPAVQSIQPDGKYDSRHHPTPISSSGRGSSSRGRCGRVGGLQQE